MLEAGSWELEARVGRGVEGGVRARVGAGSRSRSHSRSSHSNSSSRSGSRDLGAGARTEKFNSPKLFCFQKALFLLGCFVPDFGAQR